jgi:hypothetical protein
MAEVPTGLAVSSNVRFALGAIRATKQPQIFSQEQVGKQRGEPVTRVDLAILHEIVRVVQARAKVPERVRIQKRDYQITYLEDHRQRIEEALRRHDGDRLSMLFGQLASKVKYQLLRRAPAPSATRAQARAPRSRSTTTARGRASARTPAAPRKRARAR